MRCRGAVMPRLNQVAPFRAPCIMCGKPSKARYSLYPVCSENCDAALTGEVVRLIDLFRETDY